MGQAIPTKRHIVTYLRTHMETWFAWANSSALGFDTKIQKIKFVSGTLKASKWACAAFSGSYRKKKGSLTLNVAGVGDINMNIAIKNQTVPSNFYNHGPSLPTGTHRARLYLGTTWHSQLGKMDGEHPRRLGVRWPLLATSVYSSITLRSRSDSFVSPNTRLPWVPTSCRQMTIPTLRKIRGYVWAQNLPLNMTSARSH